MDEIIRIFTYKGIEFNLSGTQAEGYALQQKDFPVLFGYGRTIGEAEHALKEAIEEMYYTLIKIPNEELGKPNFELKQFLLL